MKCILDKKNSNEDKKRNSYLYFIAPGMPRLILRSAIIGFMLVPGVASYADGEYPPQHIRPHATTITAPICFMRRTQILYGCIGV
jgi:hypothetical protein